MTAHADSRLRSRAAAISLAVGVSMLAIKGAAWFITDSATILSDALESVIHVGAVGFMYWAVRFSSAPPDAEHPYGHGKAEYFSVGFEGGAIALAALGIIWQAVEGVMLGRQPGNLGLGLALIAAAAAINLGLGWWLLATGRRLRSAILVADGHHVLSDVWTSVGVLGGVGICLLLPPGEMRTWTDAGIAILLACYILWVGVRLLREAGEALLDQADPALVQEVVDAINAAREPEWLDVHNLRARRSGDQIFVDFHLMVPGDWTVARAHDVVDRLEAFILRRLGHGGSVMIHLDHPDVEMDDQVPRTMGRPLTVEIATRIGGRAARRG